MFNFRDKKSSAPANSDAEGADVDKYELDEDKVDRFSNALINTLDKVVSMQSGVIIKYVDGLKKRNPDASPEQIQAIIDKHLINIAGGSGAAAGASASIPGIGLVTGAAAIGAESILFLEAAAWYILASAYLRGDDIRDEQRRRALVLVVLTGSKGVAIVDTLVGDMGTVSGVTSAATLSRFSAPTLSGLNGRLVRLFSKQVTKRLRRAWMNKLLPMGIGAVLGNSANRKLAKQVITHAGEQLSPLPSGKDIVTTFDDDSADDEAESESAKA